MSEILDRLNRVFSTAVEAAEAEAYNIVEETPEVQTHVAEKQQAAIEKAKPYLYGGVAAAVLIGAVILFKR